MKPIYDTDLSRPLSEIIQDFRSQMSHLRGQISDVSYEWETWKGSLDNVEGLLTCGLIVLYNIMEEAEKCEERWGKDYLQKIGKTNAEKITEALDKNRCRGCGCDTSGWMQEHDPDCEYFPL